MARLAPVSLLLALLASGCDCSGPTMGMPCASADECPSGWLCRDGECEEGTAPMDAGGEDAASCPPSRACGEACCALGEACAGGACCPSASSCGDVCCAAGEACAGGACCAAEDLCGGVCCPADHACEANVCRLRCDEGRAVCGEADAARCCDAGDVCLVGECATPGRACSPTERCDEGDYCETTLGRCLPRATTTEECTYTPPVGAFEPVLEWSWTGDPDVLSGHQQVMMTPMVANLDDDNGDGVVDELDVPDVLFHSFAGGIYYDNAVMRAVRGSDGARLWPTAEPGYRTQPGGGIAIAEVDASSPGPEIFACSTRSSGSTCCDGVAGDLLMVSAAGALLRRFPDVRCGVTTPVVGDMDNDGTPEIAARYHIVHADGATVASVASRASTTLNSVMDFVTMADLDGDGDLELVGGNGAYHHDGTPLWERLELTDGYPAIADVDMDGAPEVVVVAPGDHSVRALNGEDGTDLWGPVDVNQGMATGSPGGGGPPTIADFDGDGLPEIATAGGYGYVVFEGEDGAPKWFRATQDLSSRVTGSSVFDFDGDGAAEVVYNDEQFLRVYSGTDGTVLLEECSTSGTLWEYPVIVDVDNDDHAEIIVMNNDYGGQRCADGSAGRHGIRIYGDAEARWVRTRRVWNLHTYHVTNIAEDLSIPTSERANWTVPGLNNFRQNVQPEGVLDAPDLVVVDVALDTARCPSEVFITLRVLNRGRAGAPAGIPVEVFDVDPSGGGASPVASVTTTRRLLPGESEVFRVELPITIAAGEPFSIWLTVNSGPARVESLRECREDNNTSGVELFCPGLM